jgi:hypothetical protein
MFTEFRKEYTEHEILQRAYQRERITDNVGRFVNYLGNGEGARALDELWVKQPEHTKDASFGTNTGFYVGIHEVERHLVDEVKKRREDEMEEYRAAGKPAEFGLGQARQRSATTPLLYIANDGKTARMLIYDLGMSAKGHPDGTAETVFDYGLMFLELAEEDGEFKIWHVVYEHDMSIPNGVNYNETPTIITDPSDPSLWEVGDPTVKKEVYNNVFGWEYLFEDMPKPYKFYDEDMGYGPNGKIGRKFYERIYN